MNSVVIMGRMVRDPEIRYSAGEDQKCVARFTVAVNRAGQKEEADFISCIAFAKVAEIIEKYFKKGKPICLAGHIHSGSYEKDGQKFYSQTVVVDRLEFVPFDRAASEQVSMNEAPEGFSQLDEDIPF